MSWFREDGITWLQKFCINVLKEGPIPKHIAFIMDGNRRYATKHSMDKMGGHNQGFEKLAEVLKWCRTIGIMEVSVYAFSVENFKRSKSEVDKLMDLAREKFQRLLDEKEKIKRFGLCIRILGDLSLLPDDLQQLAAEVMLSSKDNNRAYLNVFFSYTSRDEIALGVRNLAEGVQDGLIKPSDVSESLLEKSLYTANSDPVDLLVRTSGEVRLSDFMLWQSSYSVLAFAKKMWPEYSIWDLLAAIFYYQRMYKIPKAAEEKNKTTEEVDDDDANMREECFISATSTPEEFNNRIPEFKTAREERRERYLLNLEKKRTMELESILKRNEKVEG